MSAHEKQTATRPWTNLGPLLASALVLLLTVVLLHGQGRRWWCACGQAFPWSGDISSSHNSQHLFDPYSLTHVLHGVGLYGLLALACPRVALRWRLWLALTVEALWEVVENSSFIIERYRTATLALDYQGDSIANSLGDILSCGIGLALARWLGLWRSVAFFLVTEGILLLWIRDDLLLNVVMLIYPLEAIKTWQTGG